MSNGITVQQVLQQIKDIKGALVGISRLNSALYHNLTRKLTKLEKDLASSCDTLLKESALEQASPSEDEMSQEEKTTEESSGTVDEEADGEEGSNIKPEVGQEDTEYESDEDLLASLGSRSE